MSLFAVQNAASACPSKQVLIELAQRGNDPLPGAALGADGLAERPALVGLAIDPTAVLSEERINN